MKKNDTENNPDNPNASEGQEPGAEQTPATESSAGGAAHGDGSYAARQNNAEGGSGESSHTEQASTAESTSAAEGDGGAQELGQDVWAYLTGAEGEGPGASPDASQLARGESSPTVSSGQPESEYSIDALPVDGGKTEEQDSTGGAGENGESASGGADGDVLSWMFGGEGSGSSDVSGAPELLVGSKASGTSAGVDAGLASHLGAAGQGASSHSGANATPASSGEEAQQTGAASGAAGAGPQSRGPGDDSDARGASGEGHGAGPSSRGPGSESEARGGSGAGPTSRGAGNGAEGHGASGDGVGASPGARPTDSNTGGSATRGPGADAADGTSARGPGGSPLGPSARGVGGGTGGGPSSRGPGGSPGGGPSSRGPGDSPGEGPSSRSDAGDGDGPRGRGSDNEETSRQDPSSDDPSSDDPSSDDPSSDDPSSDDPSSDDPSSDDPSSDDPSSDDPSSDDPTSDNPPDDQPETGVPDDQEPQPIGDPVEQPPDKPTREIPTVKPNQAGMTKILGVSPHFALTEEPEAEVEPESAKIRFYFDVHDTGTELGKPRGPLPPLHDAQSVPGPSATALDGPAGVTWFIQKYEASEALGRPYVIRLQLVRFVDDMVDEEMLTEELLGKNCSIRIVRLSLENEIELSPAREIRGMIRSASASSLRKSTSLGEQFSVDVEVVPALWSLSQRINSRIFRNRTANDIVVEVLKEHLNGYQRKVRDNTTSTYPTREMCVQYEESDLDFVQRLMEEEGLYYYFLHDDATSSPHVPGRTGSGPDMADREVLVLTDDVEQLPRLETSPTPGLVAMTPHTEHKPNTIWNFQWETDLLGSSSVSVRGFDWSQEEPIIEAKNPKRSTEQNSAREFYDGLAPLTFSEWQQEAGSYGASDAHNRAKTLREIQESGLWRGHGRGDVVTLAPGYVFRTKQAAIGAEGVKAGLAEGLDQAGRGEKGSQDELLLVEVNGKGRAQAVAGEMFSEGSFSSKFSVTSKATPFRLPRETPKPRITGPHTARVVTYSGAEHDADAHGRIYVRFPWDRREDIEGDERSCRVRVAQHWAGPAYGTHFLPRDGMEVVVNFLDGDPDQPLVVGTVNNAQNRPWAAEGADLVQGARNGIVTRSTPSGGRGHRLVFDDVDGNFEFLADGDYRSQVGNDEHIRVHDRRRLKTKQFDWYAVGINHLKAIAGMDLRSTLGLRGVATGLTNTRFVAGLDLEAVGLNKDVKIYNGKDVSVGGFRREKVTDEKIINVGSDSESGGDGGDMFQTIRGNKNVRVQDGEYRMKSAGSAAQAAKSSLAVSTEDHLVLAQSSSEPPGDQPWNGLRASTPQDSEEAGLKIHSQKVMEMNSGASGEDGIQVYSGTSRTVIVAQGAIIRVGDGEPASKENTVFELGLDGGSKKTGFARMFGKKVVLSGRENVKLKCSEGPVNIKGGTVKMDGAA